MSVYCLLLLNDTSAHCLCSFHFHIPCIVFSFSSFSSLFIWFLLLLMFLIVFLSCISCPISCLCYCIRSLFSSFLLVNTSLVVYMCLYVFDPPFSRRNSCCISFTLLPAHPLSFFIIVAYFLVSCYVVHPVFLVFFCHPCLCS